MGIKWKFEGKALKNKGFVIDVAKVNKVIVKVALTLRSLQFPNVWVTESILFI